MCFCFWFWLDWTAANIDLPDQQVIKNINQDYLSNVTLQNDQKELLFKFLHEIVGCVSINWKEKAIKGGHYSNFATQSDESFAFLLKLYRKIIPGGIRDTTPKKEKLVGARMEAAIEFFDNTMKEMKMMKLP